jgi:hypothetical protein
MVGCPSQTLGKGEGGGRTPKAGADDKTTSNQEILMKIANAILAGSFVVLAALGGAGRAQPPEETVKNIVLVHGAFVDGSSWAKTIPILESRGSTSPRCRTL